LHGGGNFEKESHIMDRKFEVGKWGKKKKKRKDITKWVKPCRIRLHNE
jgi:hypothetical protein